MLPELERADDAAHQSWRTRGRRLLLCLRRHRRAGRCVARACRQECDCGWLNWCSESRISWIRRGTTRRGARRARRRQDLDESLAGLDELVLLSSQLGDFGRRGELRLLSGKRSVLRTKARQLRAGSCHLAVLVEKGREGEPRSEQQCRERQRPSDQDPPAGLLRPSPIVAATRRRRRPWRRGLRCPGRLSLRHHVPVARQRPLQGSGPDRQGPPRSGAAGCTSPRDRCDTEPRS